jgi:predicted outer membrane lipoprotein
MVKVFGLLSLVAALGVSTVLWWQHTDEVRKDAPTAVLQAATTALELNHRIRGTYAGVTFSDVKVVRADARSYCIEAAGNFVAGPNGRPRPGRC